MAKIEKTPKIAFFEVQSSVCEIGLTWPTTQVTSLGVGQVTCEV